MIPNHQRGPGRSCGNRGALEDLRHDIALDHLERRRAWEVAEHLDRLGPGVLGDALSLEKLLELLERRRGPALRRNDRGAGALAETVVGERHDRDLADIRVAHDHRLYLGGDDRDASASDDVLAAPDVDELPVLVEIAEI